MDDISDVLLPTVDHCEAMELRGGRVFRGRLIDQSREGIRQLRARVRPYPGSVVFDKLGGETYVTYQHYEGMPPVRWRLHAALLAITVLTTMLAHSQGSLDHFYGHMRWVVHECQMIFLTLTGFAAGGMSAMGERLATLWPHMRQAPQMMTQGVWFSAGILSILLVHESGHYFTARRYGMVVTPPYFLPLPFGVGTLGAVIRLRTPMLHRRSLFAIGAAGPIAGLIVALAVLSIGISLSQYLPDARIPAGAIRGRLGDSMLTAALQWLIAGPAPPGHVLTVHPLRLAGWFGLVVTALNLVPVGQLDGGHIAYALLGRRQERLAGAVLSGLVLLGVYGAVSTFGPAYMPQLNALPQVSPMWLVCAMLIRAVMRGGHPPLLFEHVPLGRWRSAGAVLMMILLIVTFVPCPFDLRRLVLSGS